MWTPLGEAARSGLRLRAGYREVGATFESLGRIRPADYAYGWNAPALAFVDGERARDLGLDWRLARGLTLWAATIDFTMFS